MSVTPPSLLLASPDPSARPASSTGPVARLLFQPGLVFSTHSTPNGPALLSWGHIIHYLLEGSVRFPGTHRPIPLPAGHPVGPPAHPPRHPSLSRPQSRQERPTPQLPPWSSSCPILCQDFLEGTLWPRLLPPETDNSHPGQTVASGAHSPRAQTHTDRKGQVRVGVRPLPLRTVRPQTSRLSR